MKKREQIAALQARVAILEQRLVLLEQRLDSNPSVVGVPHTLPQWMPTIPYEVTCETRQ